MDIEIFFYTIMTDAKGSKSNIAAKFQNALNIHFLPPIGVFWDIENCQVPKGKSAIALVQNIREKFFSNHREAEFMCVCDIHKESKNVIQELIFAQVTVVHISATCKNAADDKLKQCMRRFVDTHGAPSTLLLISDDVNFSSDLSDYRHRHNVRIILIHRGHAHQSLLSCAHEHYDFSAIAFDLPSRSPVKSSSNRPNMLIVTELPTRRSAGQVKTMLRKLSVNCGGKVLEIRGSKAYLKFANADAAERAQKRMDKEIVFGNEISVNFCNSAEYDCSLSPNKRNQGYISSDDTSDSSTSSRESSSSPTRETKRCRGRLITKHKKFDFPPPPVLDNQTLPTLLRNTSFKEFSPQVSNTNIFSPGPSNMEVKDGNFQLDWNRSKCQSFSITKSIDPLSFSPFKKESDFKNKYSQKTVGRVSPFLMQESDKNIRSSLYETSNIRRSVSQSGNNSNPYLFSNRIFENSTQNISPFEAQCIKEPYFYSSTWSGSATMSDSALSVRNNPVSAIDSSSVELYVSNLDPAFDVNEMKKILLSVFREHVMVLHISMSLQPDGIAKATVKVPSLQDAQFAISRLHRKKIGHKRILISHVSSEKTLPFYILRSETVALLNDIPTKSLPLIKFRELYEKRYHRPIAVSELYKMREAVTIQGDSGSRIVYLNPEYCNTPSLPDSEDSQEYINVEKPYCEVHFHVSASQGWAERYNICPLPLVHISLKILATAVHTLLDSHQGSLPLISFCDCYEAEVGSLPIVGTCTSSAEDSLEVSVTVNQTYVDKGLKGVPLEHLIACIAGVEVTTSALSIKKVQWLENRTDNTATMALSPALMGQLTLFGREVVDLLKSQAQCLVPFKKFIPTYHHHFGRQCRVADYGFTKLIHLLEAIPHIAQVLGEGQNRLVTLTHRTQVKRFSAELLRILKSRASKQITISEFAQAYEQVIERTFEVTNYGVCEIEDMLDEVPENVVITSCLGSETVISIPRREQTPDEIERTKLFSEEVVELMKHTINCTMAFNKFIPSYHHHFGKQCRMADYGFTKLIELFEAIPTVLEVKGTGEEKVLKLLEAEQHKILTERLIAVLRTQPNEMVDVIHLCNVYAQVHGHALRPSDFGFADLNELLQKLDYNFMVVKRASCQYVSLVDHDLVRQISQNIRRLLMEEKGGKLLKSDVFKRYRERFGLNTNLNSYLKYIGDDIQEIGGFLQLAPLQFVARNLILLLQDNYSQVHLCNLSNLYQQKFGVPLCVSDYGFSSMFSLLEHLNDYFVVKGKKNKRAVHLKSQTAVYPLPNYPLFPQMIRKQNGADMKNGKAPNYVLSNMETHMKGNWEHTTGFEAPTVQDIVCVAEPFSKKNVPVMANAIRTSNTSVVSASLQNEFPFNIASTSTLSCLAPSFEIHDTSLYPAKPFTPNRVADNSVFTNKSPIKSVIQISKNYVSECFTSPSVNSSDTVTRFSEQSVFNTENSSLNLQSYTSPNHNHTVYSKNDNSSNKSTPTSEGKQQSRRSRIAAQFSSPIND